MSQSAEALRRQILDLVTAYYAAAHPARAFEPGESSVPVSGRVFDDDDMRHLVDASLDFWLTTGRYAERFEREFAQIVGARYALLVNSGSSANLAALSALTSPRLGERRLRPGDEVITVAAGFPTTVNPIFQNQLVPVFVDVDTATFQVRADQIEQAVGPRTRAVMIAHALGNPFDLETVTAICRKHQLWLVEDCCDALGATYRGRHVGTFGDLATVSFYPAHHITMGEGGCVFTSQPVLKTLVESFRDWGRDCWCAPGKENTCGKRFDWQLGDLPHGYDHKYTYSHVGYNLKLTDMQAAVGVAQLSKLPRFIEARRANFRYLLDALKPLDDVLVLPQPTPGADPSWFGFPFAIRDGAPFTRDALVRHLEERKIATRLIFAGNLIRQPAYRDLTYRVVSNLAGADFVMRQALWVGIYPGLTRAMLDYTAASIIELCRKPAHA